ncbi:MAG: M28 family peptidase [Chloroflexi bacterium]|nr:M28 family peptidase [Chloroflexota bacterium]
MPPETELTQHLHHLSVHIGPRMMGSPGDHAAAAYIRQVFANAGLQVEEQRWDCPYWSSEAIRLEVNGQPLPAYANTYSPSCDVTAPTVAIGTIAELQAAELVDRIGILYGDLASAPLTNIGYTIYNPERDRQINALLQAKRPAALLTLEPFSRVYEPLIQDWDLGIPSASVTHEVGLRLLQNTGQTARLMMTNRSTPSSSASIIGRTTSRSPNRLVLCAHYDTKRDTPGAVDNGAGAAALLALAHRLARLPLDIGLEFVAFGGEEYYASGDVEYARRNDGRFGNILAAINLDGVGQRLGANTVTMLAESAAFHDLVAEVVQQYPGVTWAEPWYASNHYTFFARGVPSIALTSAGTMNILHRPADTMDWVSPAKLAEVVSLVTVLVERLHPLPLAWTRPPA